MDERILALLGTLAEIKRELGPAVYDGAVERARLAIAAEVMVEAERRTLRARPQPEPNLKAFQVSPGRREGNVVHLSGRIRAREGEQGGSDASA
ncbi:hypothetical protein [Methylorubrum thiocyanatum]|uniref:hypothetical protein n=1 Tax=Methylorubrum thiocyanatum TaxID=47958 RepID=UPI0035C7E479